jgi:hypothetical protein
MTIDIDPKHKGKLHSALGIKPDEKIPTSKLHKAEKKAKPGSALSKEIVFAENARTWNHKE